MKIRELIEPPVAAAEVDESLAEAAVRMNACGIAALPVFSRGSLVGIVTERDIVRAIADGANPHQTEIDGYMSLGPATIGLNVDADEAVNTMCRLGIRHLPVQDGHIVGMVSVKDLLLTSARVKARAKARRAERSAS